MEATELAVRPSNIKKSICKQTACHLKSVSYFRPRKKAKVCSKVKEGGRRA